METTADHLNKLKELSHSNKMNNSYPCVLGSYIAQVVWIFLWIFCNFFNYSRGYQISESANGPHTLTLLPTIANLNGNKRILEQMLINFADTICRSFTLNSQFNGWIIRSLHLSILSIHLIITRGVDLTDLIKYFIR